MRRDVTSGILLIAGALTGVLALSLHPTAHDMLGGADAAGQARLGVVVHAVAIAGIPLTFAGLLGLTRRLGWSEPATAALIAYGFGAVAGMGAAVASGFVATPLTQEMLASPGAMRDLLHAQLGFAGLLNQGFAKVHLVATATAIVLWSTAILRGTTMPRAAGVAGVVIGALVLLGFFAGHLRLDVHGFGIVMLVEGAWLVWIGILLWRGDRGTDAADPGR